MALRFTLLATLCLSISLVTADYTYSSWYDLPQCAKNCLTTTLAASSNWGDSCSGTDISCACNVKDGFHNYFDDAFSSCIQTQPWVAKNSTGGCVDAPSNQMVDYGELTKYEHDIFCFLNNATCPHTGCQSASASTTPSTTPTKTSTIVAVSTVVVSASSGSSSFSSFSATTTTSINSSFPVLATTTSDQATSQSASQTVPIVTVGVVVTANTTLGMTAPTRIQTMTVSPTGSTNGSDGRNRKAGAMMALVVLTVVRAVLA